MSSRNSSTELTATAPGRPAAVSPAVSAASTAPSPPGVGMIEPKALPVRYTTAMLAIGTCRPPNAATHAARHRMYAALSSSAPPMPWASLRGCWATSSRRGSTWPSIGAARSRISRRLAGMLSTATPTAARPASTKYDQVGGRSECSRPVPVIATNTTSSRMCSTNATPCQTPTLAAAAAAGILRRCR